MAHWLRIYDKWATFFLIWYLVGEGHIYFVLAFWTWLKFWLIQTFLFGNHSVSFTAFTISAVICQNLLLFALILLSETEAGEMQTVQQMAEGFDEAL